MASGARVLVLGDNELSREGLKRLLNEAGFQADSFSAADVPDALHHAVSPADDAADLLVLVDVMEERDGLELCRSVRKIWPDARLVMIGSTQHTAIIREAFEIGIDGYLPRDMSCDPMLRMLELVLLGEKVLRADLVRGMSPPNGAQARRGYEETMNSLSGRETEILHCLVEGDSNKSIARKLGIAEATVKVHIKAILRKLQVLNRTQAAVWVAHHGR